MKSFTFTNDIQGSMETYLALPITGYSEEALKALKNVHAALAPNTAASQSTQKVAVPEDQEAVEDLEIDGEAAEGNYFKKLKTEYQDRLVKGQIQLTGWTKTALDKALQALPKEQKRVVEEALKNDGVVSRAVVYELNKYDAERSLRGFTRPARGVMAKLQKAGDLPENAETLLERIDDPQLKHFQRAQGFRVPLETVVLYRD